MTESISLKSNQMNIINIDEALEIKDDIEIVYKRKSTTYIGYLSLILVILLGSIYFYYNFVLRNFLVSTQAERIDFFKYEIILYFLVGMTLWISIHLIITILVIIYGNIQDEYFFLSTILNNHDLYITLVITSILLSSFILMNSNIFIIEKDSRNICLRSFFIDNFPNMVMGLSIFLLIIFIKDMIVNMAVYKMHFNSYKERIKTNRKDLRMLEALNMSSGRNMYENVGDWARFVFFRISGDNKSINYEDLKNKFHTEFIGNFYKFFNCKIDRKITEKDFVMMYKVIIQERRRIGDIFKHKKHIIDKFNRIMSILIYPMAFVCMQSIVGWSFKSINIVQNTQILLSINFVFAGVVTEVFNSLVFTFLVRSFDIGDTLMINNMIYTVLDIGIMFSEFSCNNKNVLISNSRLRNEKITNFRLCKLKQTEFIFNLKTESFEEDKKVLEKEIMKYQKKNRKFYKGPCVLRTNEDKDICVTMTYKLKNNKIEKITEEEDAFKLFMYDNLLKMNT